MGDHRFCNYNVSYEEDLLDLLDDQSWSTQQQQQQQHDHEQRKNHQQKKKIYVQVRFRHKLQRYHAGVGIGHGVGLAPIILSSFEESLVLDLNGDGMPLRSLLYNKAGTLIPRQDQYDMVSQFCSRARVIARQARNDPYGRCMVPIGMDVEIVETESYAHSVPTSVSQSFLQELEKKVVSFDHHEHCAICLENYSAAAAAAAADHNNNNNNQVIHLPCSHLFHKYCILPWLRKSHLCPNCRFELPCDTDESLY